MTGEPTGEWHTFADLGTTPYANAFVAAGDPPEERHPLRARVRASDLLVQLDHFAPPDELFGDYAYFSSYSDSWLEHARAYAAEAVARFSLDGASRVVEVGSNDGYLLRHFVQRGIPCLGIDPAVNVAEVARQRGVPTITEFFGTATAASLAAQGEQADLLIGNNVLAHVPDLDDFVRGARLALEPAGVLSVEFPHLLKLIEETQFDTIYHEHYSYLSFHTVRELFARHDLSVFDVAELPTHGGSLRVYAGRPDAHPVAESVARLESKEAAAGITKLETYLGFQEQVEEAKRRILQFLAGVRSAGRTVAGYGAPAKGNTLLNYCGVGPDLLPFTVDRSPHKQGKLLPGSRIPVHHPDEIARTRPDYVLILPWNLKDEIVRQMAHVREWGGRFVVPVPHVAEVA